MNGAGAGGAAPERRKQLTAAEAVNHKRQLAQVVERELARRSGRFGGRPWTQGAAFTAPKPMRHLPPSTFGFTSK